MKQKTIKRGRPKLLDKNHSVQFSATLSNEVYSKFEKYLQKFELQNRSKMIEYIIKEYLMLNHEWED